MNVSVIASTKDGYVLPVADAELHAGHAAGICYMKDDFDSILAEPAEKTERRFAGTAGSGHHSVSGHPSYNLLIEGIPKIIAMILNNEQDYNTSEKSARYTTMTTSDLEREIYEKWIEKFTALISARYPVIPATTVNKLAKENARYFISIFTPSTVMEYTVDFRQGNYLIGFMEDLAKNSSVGDLFYDRLRPYLIETAKQFRSIFNDDRIRDNKGRKISLFGNRERREYFGDVYSVNYSGSFAEMAQAHRHRSLKYEMLLPDLADCEFFVPPIIRDADTRSEYLADMDKLKENYPQGMIVRINERGTLEAFISKCHERLCGAAQLEICLQTKETLERYISGAILDGDVEVYKALRQLEGKTKCAFGYYHCDRPCPLGPANAFTREI